MLGTDFRRATKKEAPAVSWGLFLLLQRTTVSRTLYAFARLCFRLGSRCACALAARLT